MLYFYNKARQKIILLSVITIFCIPAWSNSLEVTLKLASIKASVTTEVIKDEIYFDIHQYFDEANSQYHRVPMFPLYWSSGKLKNLKGITLLKTVLQLSEKQEITIALSEYDGAALSLNDHIGSVKLNIYNNNTELKTNWSIPKLSDQSEVLQFKKNLPLFELSGDGSKYIVEFDIESNIVTE